MKTAMQYRAVSGTDLQKVQDKVNALASEGWQKCAAYGVSCRVNADPEHVVWMGKYEHVPSGEKSGE